MKTDRFTKSLCVGYIILLFYPTMLSAQQFTQLLNDPLTTTPGDSRSINIIDVNGDGFEDIYVTNGLSGGQNNELYINQGNGAFTATASQSLVQDNSPSDGATCADTDNDGDIDCFMVTWYNQPNFYYVNDGNGLFTHLTQAVTGTSGTYSETATLGDYDQDGLLDIYITNSEGDLKNMLYRNTGNHNFTKIIAPWLNEAKASRGAAWSDYDNDGDLDLYVAHESNTANSLFRNNGDGSFNKVTADPAVQAAQSSMTVSWGDVNNDGYQDLFVGNAGYFQPQTNQLFINNGNGGFVAAPSGPVSTDASCAYGSAFADYDNDGDLDIFVANGFCNGNLVNFLYKNDGNGVFERDLNSLPNFATPCSFGAAWGDLNHDGFQDLVVATCKNTSGAPQPNNLAFINTGNGNHWLEVALKGTVSNHSAIGAKIKVTANIEGDIITQMREISSQTGYCGQNSLTAHFGLGNATTIESMQVIWPSGIEQLIGNIATDQIITIAETNSSDATVPDKNDLFHLAPLRNPFGDQFAFSLTNGVFIQQIRFQILDQLGRKCAEKTASALSPGKHSFEISTESLPKGVYQLLFITDDGYQQALKVIRH